MVWPLSERPPETIAMIDYGNTMLHTTMGMLNFDELCGLIHLFHNARSTKCPYLALWPMVHHSTDYEGSTINHFRGGVVKIEKKIKWRHDENNDFLEKGLQFFFFDFPRPQIINGCPVRGLHWDGCVPVHPLWWPLEPPGWDGTWTMCCVSGLFPVSSEAWILSAASLCSRKLSLSSSPKSASTLKGYIDTLHSRMPCISGGIFKECGATCILSHAREVGSPAKTTFPSTQTNAHAKNFILYVGYVSAH